MFYKKYLKRWFDVFFAVILLSIAWPLFALSTFLIKIESNGPIIFKQERIGYGGQVFYIFKFRSMKENSEYTGSGVYSDKYDNRVTRMGKFLRATSIDELPQLINILRGEMSFIGPRPPLTYHPWPISVRPGITGWAQVNGRKCVEWHKRIDMNVWYVENVSLLLDLRILFLTFFKVLLNVDNENNGQTVECVELKTDDCEELIHNYEFKINVHHK